MSKKKKLPSTKMARKNLKVWAFILLFAAGGTYLTLHINAAVYNYCKTAGECANSEDNPPLAQSCGLDVALLIDTSDSMEDELAGVQRAARAFATHVSNTNTQIAVAAIDNPALLSFSSDTNTVLNRINQLALGQSRLIDVRHRMTTDPRPNKQNLIIVLSDFKISYDTADLDRLKRSGTRILGLLYGVRAGDAPHYNYFDVANVSGRNINTGSVLTSDVITLNRDSVGAEFASFAQQLCGDPVPSPNPGPNPGTNPGPGNGNGTGTGNGSGSGGSGTGTNGSGQGQSPGTGTGGGGGGSTSNKPDDKPNPLPSPTGQGDTNKQPDVEPSPFFDGKLFAIGSDVDSEDIRGVSIAGQKFGLGWVYLAILLAIVTGLLALYFFWWRRMSEKDKGRWKKRVRLGR